VGGLPITSTIMKIIFLDFDGVLLTCRTRLGSNGRSFSDCPPDPLACGLLQRICKAGCQIVVSSTWRETANWRSKLVEGCLEAFLHPEDPTTPCLHAFGTRSRPKEIEDWLERHPEVTDYRIVDDDAWEWFPGQEEHWVQCDPANGLQSSEMHDLIAWMDLQPHTLPRITVKRIEQCGDDEL